MLKQTRPTNGHLHAFLVRAALAVWGTLCCIGCFPAAADTLERGIISIEYHPDDAADAAWAGDVLTGALEEYAVHLPAGDKTVRVVLAHTVDEFLHEAGDMARLSVAGFARGYEGLIVIKGPRLRLPGDDVKGTLRHELVHVLLARNVNDAYLPRWLNEGIAMLLANEYTWASPMTVARMFFQRSLIEYKDLDWKFLVPGDEMEFGDAYAQAFSMTRYLRKQLGEETFWKLVLAMREMPFADALEKFGGMTVLDFWGRYRYSLVLTTIIGAAMSGSFFTPAAFLVIIAWFRKRRKAKALYKKWDREDAEERALQPNVYTTWDEVVEDPEAWKDGTEYEETEDWR